MGAAGVEEAIVSGSAILPGEPAGILDVGATATRVIITERRGQISRLDALADICRGPAKFGHVSAFAGAVESRIGAADLAEVGCAIGGRSCDVVINVQVFAITIRRVNPVGRMTRGKRIYRRIIALLKHPRQPARTRILVDIVGICLLYT